MDIVTNFTTTSGLAGRLIEVRRDNSLGCWWRCGYVGIDKSSPLFGVEYNNEDHDLEDKIKVHGGLTFSDHFPSSDLWWFGFDTAHCFDSKYGGQPESYVIAQIELLAAQIKELENA